MNGKTSKWHLWMCHGCKERLTRTRSMIMFRFLKAMKLLWKNLSKFGLILSVGAFFSPQESFDKLVSVKLFTSNCSRHSRSCVMCAVLMLWTTWNCICVQRCRCHFCLVFRLVCVLSCKRTVAAAVKTHQAELFVKKRPQTQIDVLWPKLLWPDQITCEMLNCVQYNVKLSTGNRQTLRRATPPVYSPTAIKIHFPAASILGSVCDLLVMNCVHELLAIVKLWRSLLVEIRFFFMSAEQRGLLGVMCSFVVVVVVEDLLPPPVKTVLFRPLHHRCDNLKSKLTWHPLPPTRGLYAEANLFRSVFACSYQASTECRQVFSCCCDKQMRLSQLR